MRETNSRAIPVDEESSISIVGSVGGQMRFAGVIRVGASSDEKSDPRLPKRIDVVHDQYTEEMDSVGREKVLRGLSV